MNAMNQTVPFSRYGVKNRGFFEPKRDRIRRDFSTSTGRFSNLPRPAETLSLTGSFMGYAPYDPEASEEKTLPDDGMCTSALSGKGKERNSCPELLPLYIVIWKQNRQSHPVKKFFDKIRQKLDVLFILLPLFPESGIIRTTKIFDI